MSALGDLVRSARRRAGISQRSLALRAGSTQAAISRIESGRERPSYERAEQLLLVIGERIVVGTEPLLGATEVVRLRETELTPEERLLEAVSWNRLATELEQAHPAR